MSSAYLNLLDEYDFSDDKLQDSFGIRPPQISILMAGGKWESHNASILFNKALATIPQNIRYLLCNLTRSWEKNPFYGLTQFDKY